MTGGPSREKWQADYGAYFSLLLCLWATIFIEFWKRKSSDLSLRMDVLDVNKLSNQRDLARRVRVVPASESLVSRIITWLLTTSLVIGVMYVFIKIMLHYIAMMYIFEKKYPAKNSLMKYYPLVEYVLITVVMGRFIKPFVEKLISWGSSPSKFHEERQSVYMRLSLAMVNYFCFLLYFAFVDGRIECLRTILLLFAVWTSVLSLFLDYTLNLIIYLLEKFRDSTVLINGGAGGSTYKYIEEQLHYLRHDLDAETSANLGDEYVGLIVVQFGYVAMFSTVQPLLPALALCKAYYQGALDFAGLGEKTERFLLENRSGSYHIITIT